MPSIHPCLLCRSENTYELPHGNKTYYRCRECRLVFLDPHFHLDPAAEKAFYDRNSIDVDDPGYRCFLSRSFNEVLKRVEPPARGLDFGCGPQAVLVAMAREAGYAMDVYDKFYADDRDVLNGTYDFITCTEVAEHLSDPADKMDLLWSLVKPGGLLIVQTKRVLDDERFKAWFYRNYPTHITFFSQVSFEWLAGKWETDVFFPHDDVAVFIKHPETMLRQTLGSPVG